MKKLLIIFLLFIGINVNAKNIYISSISGSDAANGLTTSTPWQTIDMLNASWASINAGDSILFKRGEIFYGVVRIGKSGTSGNSIIFSAYGTGAKPVISGFTTLSSWTNLGGNVWRASANPMNNRVNLVTVGGLPQQVAREPNAGYLTYEAFSSNVSITDNQASATNIVGDELVLKKDGYILERAKITAQIGNTYTYAPFASINPRNGDSYLQSSVNPSDTGFGYFKQNDVRFLDTLNEFWYDSTNKFLRVYSTSMPTNVKISTLDTLVNLGSFNYITFDNVDFEGSNVATFYNKDGGNIVLKNGNINTTGAKGIFLWNSPNTLIDNFTINYALCGGIDITQRGADNVTVRNCIVTNTATIAGMGSNYDEADMKAIYVIVRFNLLIEYNKVDVAGYTGIEFAGSFVTIQYNYVNYYCFVKDDGGGIYSAGNGNYAVSRIIRYNIITNGIGSSMYLTSIFQSGNKFLPHVEGIYSDNGCRNININNNIVAYIKNRGIYINNGGNITVRSNIFFGCGSNTISSANGVGGWGIQKTKNDSAYNIRFVSNIVYQRFSYEPIFFLGGEDFTSTKPFIASSINTFLTQGNLIYSDSNQIAYSSSSNLFNGYYTSNGSSNISFFWSLATMRTNTNNEINTTVLPNGGLLFFNNSNVSVNISTPYIWRNDATGAVFSSGSILIESFKGMVLVNIGTVITIPTTNPPIKVGLIRL